MTDELQSDLTTYFTATQAPPRTGIFKSITREPLAAKVPEITAMFWVIKILTTAMGEAISDYLGDHNRMIGAVVEIGLFCMALYIQLRAPRYSAVKYWFVAVAIAIFGTGVSDTLHIALGIPYAGTTLLWVVVLSAIFFFWYRSEGTLSIHSIVTTRREEYYWATVFATFALGTALGDFTATALNLGFLASGIMFGVVILVPLVAWWRFRLNAILAFWAAYVTTRPLGASFADYISKPHHMSGIDFGDGPTAALLSVAVIIGVCWVAIRGKDTQRPYEIEV